MSRKIITMGVALAILLLVSLVEQVAVRRITDGMLDGTQAVIAQIRAQELHDAMARAREMDARWDEQARMLETVVDHSSTDEVRYAFSRLIAALEAEDTPTAMVYAFELEGAIEHVYERQALTLENVF